MVGVEEIIQITQNIWTSVLGMEIAVSGRENTDEATFRTVAGCVQMHGGSDLSVVVRCTSRLARQAAAAMLCVEPDEPSTDEVLDALGELTNLIGGGLKNRIEGPTSLSVPAVAEGSEMSIRPAGAHLLHLVSFDCQGELAQVALLRRNAEAAA